MEYATSPMMSLKVGIKRKRVQISDSLSFNHLGVESSRQPKMNRKIPKTTFSVTFMTAQMISNNVPMIIIFSSKVLRFFRLCKPLLEEILYTRRSFLQIPRKDIEHPRHIDITLAFWLRLLVPDIFPPERFIEQLPPDQRQCLICIPSSE